MGPEDFIKHSPIIRSVIMKNLEFQTLKQARLVSKLWFHEAGTHMERRAIVRFDRDTTSARIREFGKLRRKETPALPQPFLSIDLDLNSEKLKWVLSVIEQFSSRSRKPKLKRFSTVSVGMKLAYRLIIEHSSSLEYLKLSRQTFEDALVEEGHVPELPDGQEFKKLRHLVVDDVEDLDGDDIQDSMGLASFVGGIVNGSPNLETFESQNETREEGSELLRTVKIKNVTTLKLVHTHVQPPALQHLFTINFSNLENLKVGLFSYGLGGRQCLGLSEIIGRCLPTLRVLDLSDIRSSDDLAALPLCSNIRELKLHSLFPNLINFLLRHFSGLQVLSVKYVNIDVLGKVWRRQPTFPTLKTLRVPRKINLSRGKDGREAIELLVKFFEKFPGLECLRLDVTIAARCCKLKANGQSRFSKLIKGWKHLELYGRYVKYLSPFGRTYDADDADYSTLAALKGIETITLLESNEKLMYIPVQDMPCLRVLRFPWTDHHSMDKLLDLARRVERVVITNCCSVPRVANPWSNDALNSFFKSAPNVQCGCCIRLEGREDAFTRSP